MNPITQDQINKAAWGACDTFRGVVDPSIYKDYVLTLLFLKYLSDVWKDHRARYEDEHGDHPDLIDAGLAEWEDASCDFEAMSRDQAFRNDFLDNMRRFSAYVSDVTGRQSDVIESLRATIASSMQNVRHAPESGPGTR